MLQVNDHTASDKLFHIAIKDLTLNSIALTGSTPNSNPAVKCLFHANWVHYMSVEGCTFYGASTGSDGIGVLLTAVGPAFSEEFSMLNSFTDCEFTYNYHGMKFGVTGQGSINASQVYRCRFGGTATGTGTGIEIRGGTYNNSFVDNDIEIYETAIDASDTVNYFRGNLCEQNTTDFVGGLGSQSVGNKFNTVSSNETGTFINEHGIVRALMVEKTAPNLIVDPQFNTKLYESTFLGTSIVPKTGLASLSITRSRPLTVGIPLSYELRPMSLVVGSMSASRRLSQTPRPTCASPQSNQVRATPSTFLRRTAMSLWLGRIAPAS
jgi:hypothetical protein